METVRSQLAKNRCRQCANKLHLDFDFTMAFQPIIDMEKQEIFGYEALVRGPNNESAASVLNKLNDENRYAFDQSCRVKAIALATKLNLDAMLCINFLPNAISQPERCIRTTLAAAKEYAFPIERIMFEFTEAEKMLDSDHVKRVVEYNRELGFTTAIDDFGAGYAGLGLLANFQTDLIKLDMELIRNIDSDETRQVIVTHLLSICHQLKIRCLVEGIETPGEMHWLNGAGVNLMQGYLFAKPGFECLPEVTFPFV